jgi:hypothetical protein
MLGRLNKELIIRLIKTGNARSYDIIVTRKRSAGDSRLDKIGSVTTHAPYSWVKVDFNKLQKYLLEKNVKIATSVAKILGLDDMHLRKKSGLYKNVAKTDNAASTITKEINSRSHFANIRFGKAKKKHTRNSI